MFVGKSEQEALKESNGIFLSSAGRQILHVLDVLPFYVIFVDSAHNIIAANLKLMQDLNLKPEQLIGAKCPITVHGSSTPVKNCPLVQASLKGEAVEEELYDPGNGRWMRAAVFPTQLVTDDSRKIFMHFVRDVTDIKKTEQALSQSLEHHSALCDLLQRFQYCQTSTEIIAALVGKIISLSWLGLTSTAAGFLAENNSLRMVFNHNISTVQLERCQHVEFGECLCGKAAQTGQSIVCSSSSPDHVFQNDGMDEHRHAVIPISHEGKILGVITLYLKSGLDLNTPQLDFLNAASSAAAAALAGQLAREEVKRVREKSMAQVFSYQEEERQRIARELHDQVCQSLSALLLKMQAHGQVDESVRELKDGCEARILGIIDEVRRMARDLRPTILDDYGLEMALARHIEEISSRVGLTIDYQYISSPDCSERLPAPVEVGLYRIAIEALDNIVVHASASRASAIVLRQRSKLMLLIEDDGCGFDYSSIRKDLDRCVGLIGMEERVTLMGGAFQVESTPQKGTTVRVEIPVENK